MAEDEEAAVPMTAGMGSLVYKGHWPNLQEQSPCTGNAPTATRDNWPSAQRQAVTEDLESPYTSPAVRREHTEKEKAN